MESNVVGTPTKVRKTTQGKSQKLYKMSCKFYGAKSTKRRRRLHKIFFFSKKMCEDFTSTNVLECKSKITAKMVRA